MGDKRKKILTLMRNNPNNIKFCALAWLCSDMWGAVRIKGSHHIWATGKQIRPLVIIQPDGKLAKGYQVRQVLRAVDSE